MKFNIGCSGYYYPAWKNKFYPSGMPPKKWLEYYSSVFNTVEMNGSFYRMPKPADLKKYAAITPPDFTFAVKVSRYISHVQRLKEKQSVVEFIDRITDGLGEKVTRFLFQMPPSFAYSEENLEKLVINIPHRAENIIEFRHISWWNDSVRKEMTEASLTFCNVDFPGLSSYFIQTTPFFYLRLHGNPELFISSYGDERLSELFNGIPENAAVANIYFNNTMYEAGYTNAIQMKALSNNTLLA